MKRLFLILTAACLIFVMFAVVCSASVTEPYVRGDADGSGEVDIVDATRIQRVILHIDKDEDGMVALRGDVNGDGLDSVDATFIQRHTVNMSNVWNIGETIYPEQPTEQQTEKPTQAPTQKPTRDGDELPFVPKR